MRRAVCCVVTLVLFAVSTGESLAGIIVTADDRYLLVPGPGANSWNTNPPTVLPTNTLASPGAATFSEYITSIAIGAGARQTSSLQAGGFSGSGGADFSGYGTPLGTTEVVQSVFDVSFQVTEPVWFSWGGSRNDYVAGQVNPPAAFTRSLISSLGGPVALIDEERPAGEWFTAGVLMPGVDYELTIAAAQVPLSAGNFTNWNFVFTVPEPKESLLASVCLLAAAALALARRAA